MSKLALPAAIRSIEFLCPKGSVIHENPKYATAATAVFTINNEEERKMTEFVYYRFSSYSRRKVV